MRILLTIFLAIWPLIQLVNLYNSGQGFVLDVIRPYAILLVFFALLYSLMERKRPSLGSTFFWWFLFFVYLMLNIFINGSRLPLHDIFRDLFRTYLIPLAVYFAIINIGDIISRKTMAKSILLSGFISATIGIAEFISGHNLIGMVNPLVNTRMYRPNGPFDDGIGYASIVLLYIPFTYYCIKKELIGKFTGFTLLLVFSAGVFVELGRAPLIAYVIICFILLLEMNVKAIFIRTYLFSIFLVAVYLGWDVISSTRLYAKRFANPETVVGRWTQYKECFGIFMDHPLLGIGHEMYKKTHYYYIHNSFLRNLVELGAVGFLLNLSFIFSILFNKFKDTIRSGNTASIKTRISFIVIVLIIPNTIDLLNNYCFLLALFIMIAALNREVTEIHEEEVAAKSDALPLPA